MGILTVGKSIKNRGVFRGMFWGSNPPFLEKFSRPYKKISKIFLIYIY